jgi:3-oxoacyl-[acyl-carrier-protein] synthase III
VSVTAPVVVAGTGIHLPERVVSNNDLTGMIDTSDEWIVGHTGIRERRWLEPGRAVSDMCAEAANLALEAASLTPASVDVIIVATYTWDEPLRSTALLVKERLGAHRALVLDVTHAACVNGLHAMLMGCYLLQDSSIGSVLVLAADAASRVTDPQERTTRILFGDAAAAVVLRRATQPGSGLLSWDFGSELSGAVEIPAGGSRLPPSTATLHARQHYLAMDGRAVWNAATRRLPDSILSAMARAGLPVTDVSHFFMHQANLNIIKAAMGKLGIPMSRVPVTVDKLGNTGSAGVFTALHHSYSHGLLRPGDIYVLSAIGAGFQWGTLCFRHA